MRHFKPGDVIKGRFLDGEWYLASVDCENGDGTCTVSWLDGDAADRVKPAAELKLMRFNRDTQCYEEDAEAKCEPEVETANKQDAEVVLEKEAAPQPPVPASQHADAKEAEAERDREAARLLASASQHLDADDPAACVRDAEAALAIFRDSTRQQGCVADTLRLLVAARAALPGPEPGAAALALAAEELARFKREGDERGEASMLLAAAKVNIVSNQSMALQMAAQAETLLKEVGDKALHAQALSLQCQAKFLSGDVRGALTAADASLQLHDACDDKRGRAEVLHWSARVLKQLGRPEDAVTRSRRAVEFFRKIGKRKLEAAELHSIAEWSLADGSFKRALPAAEQALAICRQDGFTDWEPRALSMFCDVLVALRQFRRAWSCVETALTRVREKGDKRAEAATQEVARRLHMVQGATDKAMESVEAEQQLLRELGDKAGEMQLMHDKAEVLQRGKRGAEALEALKEALRMAEETEDVLEEARALRAINNLCVKNESFLEALKAAHNERVLQQRENNREEEANACMAIASAQFGLKDRTGAITAACEAQELFHEVGDTHGESRALALIARMQSSKQTTREALDAAEERLLVVRELGDKRLETEALQELTLLHLGAGNAAEAERRCREALELQKQAKDLEGIVEAMILLVQTLEAGATESTSRAAATRALGIANEALATSGKCKNKVIKGRALFWHAKMLFWNESYEDALREAEGATLTFRKLAEGPEKAAGTEPPSAELRELRQEEAKGLILCSLLHGLFEQPEKGLKLLDRALNLAQSCNDEVLEREIGVASRRIRGEADQPPPEELPEEVD